MLITNLIFYENLYMNAEINKLIFKTIIRVLKDNKLYNTFRASIAVTAMSGKNGVSSLYCSYLSGLINEHSIFAGCYNYDEFIKKLEKSVNMMNEKRNNCQDEETKIQFYVMESVNMILKNCIERQFDLNSKAQCKKLEKLGEQMFNSICKNLFGENFEDKTNCENPQYNEKYMKEMLKELASMKRDSRNFNWDAFFNHDDDYVNHPNPMINNDLFMNYLFNISNNERNL